MVARKENGIYVVNASFDVNRYDFDGTADQLKSNIDLVVEKARAMGMVGEGSFDMEVCRYYDSYELVVKYYFTRVENDNERGDREAAEARVKAAASAKRKAAAEKKKLKADAEYAEYERLKAKFGVLDK
jgi:hypothetical protein